MGAIDAVTDLTLVAIPILLYHGLTIPRTAKFLLLSFTSTGVFVAVAVAVKLTHVKSFRKTGDWLYDTVDLAMWSVVEVLLGVFAACAPMLRGPVASLLDAGLDVGYSSADSRGAGVDHELGALPSKKNSNIGITSTSSERGILEPTKPESAR